MYGGGKIINKNYFIAYFISSNCNNNTIFYSVVNPRHTNKFIPGDIWTWKINT